MSVAEAAVRARRGRETSLPEGRAFARSLDSVFAGRGGAVTLTPVSFDSLPDDTWDNGASIRVYCGQDEVQDFALFGNARSGGALVRWLFGYGDDELIAGDRLKDGFGETLNQIAGHLKNELRGLSDFEPRLDTPEIHQRVGSEMYGLVHPDAEVYEATCDAWPGTVIFMLSPRRQHSLAALDQAVSLLMHFGRNEGAVSRACRLLEEVRAPVLALSDMPAMGITLSWCTENLAVLINGVSGHREKALFHRVVRELDSLRAALSRLSGPSDDTAFFVPDDAVLHQLLREFCDEAARAIAEAEGILSSNTDQTASHLFKVIHTVRGSSAVFGLDQVHRVARGTQGLLGSVRESRARMSEQQFDAVRHSLYLLEDWVQSLRSALDGDGRVDWDPDLEAHARMLEHFLECGGRIAIPRSGGSPGGLHIDFVDSLRLSPKHLERLETMRAELRRWVEDASRKDAGDAESESFQVLERAHRDLAAICQSARQVPLAEALGRLARHCHEAAERFGKLVRVDVSGEGLLTPEHLVAALMGPLVHLVNNAVEHGVETAAERQSKGKRALAAVELRAERHDGQLVIDVVDDGRGIEREAVAERAHAQGLADDAIAVEVSELVFTPGLSTAEAPTGRGVGLDVVRREVQALGGTVELSSVAGAETRIRISVPEHAVDFGADMVVETVSEPAAEIVGEGELNFL